jgi:hypothetical protein
MPKRILENHTVAGAAITEEIDLLPVVGGMHETSLFGPVEDI